MPLVHLRRRYKTPARPTFKFEECRTPRSTGRKKRTREKRAQHGGGGGGSGSDRKGERYTLGREPGWKRYHPRKNKGTEYRNKRKGRRGGIREPPRKRIVGEEALLTRERRKMSKTKERPVSDNTAEREP